MGLGHLKTKNPEKEYCPDVAQGCLLWGCMLKYPVVESADADFGHKGGCQV